LDSLPVPPIEHDFDVGQRLPRFVDADSSDGNRLRARVLPGCSCPLLFRSRFGNGIALLGISRVRSRNALHQFFDLGSRETDGGGRDHLPHVFDSFRVPRGITDVAIRSDAVDQAQTIGIEYRMARNSMTREVEFLAQSISVFVEKWVEP